MDAMIDSRAAHLVDARALLGLLPRASAGDLTEIRREFARYLSRPRLHSTWQDAWNTWVGAQPGSPGDIVYTPSRCKECSGRGFSHRNVGRNMARTGSPLVCGGCRGTRRGSRVRVVALYAAVPGEPESMPPVEQPTA